MRPLLPTDPAILTHPFPAFNLVNEIDIPATEARIAAFRAENAALIQLNIQREKLDAQELQEEEERYRRDREERVLQLRREEEEERQERENERRAIIEGLVRITFTRLYHGTLTKSSQESSKEGSASRVIAKTRAEALKRTAARVASSSVPASQSKLLRSRAAAASTVPDVPHVPLTDDWYAYEDQYILRTAYEDPWSEAVHADREGIMRAGGYRVEEAWERAIRMAVGGLEIYPLLSATDAITASTT